DRCSQDKRDNLIKFIIEETDDFQLSYYLVCTYITGRSVQELHKSIIANIADNTSTLDLAPRGFGKSTVGDVDFCITKILRDPNIRIMIGSKTQTQAEAFLKEVRTHFEQNEELIRIFGDWKKSKDNVWNDREFTVNKRTIIKKEATLTALGASGAVISKHFDIIIGDDLVGLENARTERQRKNLNTWFYSSLFPTLEPDGEIHILGTRYNPLDLYEDLIKSGKYTVNIQKAINTQGGVEKSLWEDKFSLEKLKDIRSESGKIIFNMQYQNDTELAKGKIFKAQYFRYYEEYKLDYDFQTAKIRIKNAEGIERWIKVRVYMGADLAISEKESEDNDYFVLMMIGVDDERNVYVLEYVKERLTFNSQLNTIISYGRNKYPMVERIGVETVAYQKSLAQELRRLSLLPIININTSKDKVTRAMRRSANFENGKVFFREGMDDLEECLLLFPDVDHDDLFDGLDFAMTMADGGNEIRVLERKDFII
ncbi:phage terminase large subunit, partial [Lachnospiraceae bacterium OttesenSCG-928-D06]|nr:phage terminase large subunit [Lachnospiraceae bacterium OttesenSCG-928-D06]